MQRDIDLIIEHLTATVSGIHIEQLKVEHSGAADDGLWFLSIVAHKNEVEIES